MQTFLSTRETVGFTGPSCFPHIDVTGDGGGDEGDTVFLQLLDPLPDLGDEGVELRGLYIGRYRSVPPLTE